jgi:hypothetical protein
MPSTSNAEERQTYNLHQHKNNSSPSSSIVTVQRAASIGPSRSTPRPLAVPQDDNIRNHVSDGTSNFSKPVTSTESRRRSSTSYSRTSSFSGVRDGVGNLNRWSQSTTSSKGSTAHRKSDSFSRRLSIGGSGGSHFGSSNTASSNRSHKLKSYATESPPRQALPSRPVDVPGNSAPQLPPLITLPALQQIDTNRSSPLASTANTPSTAGLLSAAVRSTVPDYFGKTWEDANTREHSQTSAPLRERSPIDSLHSSTTVTTKSHQNNSPPRHRQELERSSSRGHSRNRSQVGKSSSGTVSSDKSKDRGTKPPSQKAMLSIALQKANTAVLLDNAQNIEGAMQAYSEACNLLQQVMRRSSGDEDRRKLEAIVSIYSTVDQPFLSLTNFHSEIRTRFE